VKTVSLPGPHFGVPVFHKEPTMETLLIVSPLIAFVLLLLALLYLFTKATKN
jgi:hypothetical protein